VDVLSDVLSGVRLTGAVFFDVEAYSPWASRTPRAETFSMSIAEAAAEVGYESEAAFNRAFKKFVGLPPGTWRKRRGNHAGSGGSPAGG